MPSKLKPNRRKILESILYLIDEAERTGATVTQYRIVKSLFLADVQHLSQHGRPITFDNYVAMKFGPVPSEAFDMLKPEYRPGPWMTEQWPPWGREESPEDGPRAFRYKDLKRSPNLRLLSKTDTEALSNALSTVKSLSFKELSDLTHTHPAYVAAWKEDGERKAYDMQYKLLLPDADEEYEAEIISASKYA